MAKISLTNPTSGYNLAAINDNFDKIEAEFQNKVLYRNNPVGEPNTMENDLDMNGNDILNVGTVNGLDLLNLADYITSAEAAADAAEAAYDSFDDRYLGALAGDPATDNDGNTLLIGALYWNTISSELRVYTAGGWDIASIPGAELTAAYTDVFNGTGVQTDFVLTHNAGGVNNIDTSVGGVVQVPGVDFSYSAGSKTVTFLTGAPPSGTNNVAMRYGNVFATSATAPYGGTSLTNFTIDTSTPDRRVPFTNTFPTEWNIGPGRKTVDFEFVSNGFFAAEPDNHLAVVTRCDTSVIATDVRGAGAIFGDLTWSGFDGDQAKFKPTTIIEGWSRPNIALQRYLWPETTGPRNATLQDGVRYRWIIETTVQPNTDGVYIRYRLYRQAQPTTKLAWDLLVDTGDVLDASNVSDMTKQGLVFGVAFPVTPAAWTIDIQNIQVTWGPCGNVVQDNSASLSKYGADLQGDINVLGTARRHRFATVGGPSLQDAYTFQSFTTDGATTAVFKPNGASTVANHLYSNNSSSTSTYQALVVGMSGTAGLLETFGYSAADPQIGVNIGASNRVATFKTTGINLLGGSKDIGQAIGYSSYGWGGANATAYATGVGINVDNMCLQYTIRDYLASGGALTPTQGDYIEVVLRPLWSLVSYLVKDLQNKKVI